MLTIESKGWSRFGLAMAVFSDSKIMTTKVRSSLRSGNSARGLLK